MFSAATRACTLGAGLATRACRPNAWQHHQWCGAQTAQRAIGRRLLPRPAQRQLPPPGRASVASHAYTTGCEYRDCTVGALNCVCDARRHPTDSCLAVTRRSSASAHDIHTNIRTRTRTRMHMHMHMHMHTHTHTHTSAHSHARTHECPHSHTCTHVTRGLRSPPQSRALLPGSIEA